MNDVRDVTLWQLWRFRPGATVRDANGYDWIKQRNGRWRNEVTVRWMPSYAVKSSWELLRKHGPLRRML